jgi:glycerol-3-phosphate dehydrogenase
MAAYDLAIIGGGINGCGIARDAAGRGLSVILIEQDDLGGATSSASTKLIHGGLRYLEHYEFGLVRESLREREILLHSAPHLVRPMRFVMPVVRGMRPEWMLRLGVRLYDFIGGTTQLPKSRSYDLADDPAGAPLKPNFSRALEYSDCVTDDSRLVIANAISARQKGAAIRTRTRCTAARREEGLWQLVLQSGGKRETCAARALVNAAGPWTGRFLENAVRKPFSHKIRLVKGSHMVVPRLHAHDRAYLMQNDDKRVVFAIPFAGNYTLIGTTDVEYKGDPAGISASAEEILYLCKVTSAFFRTQVSPAQVKWTYAGVRPLVDDGKRTASEVTRDYELEIDGSYGEPPLVSIFGGKLTTYRSLADQVVGKLRHWFALGPEWTAIEPLPGGELGPGGVDGLIAELKERRPFLAEAHLTRLGRSYGARPWTLLGDAKRMEDLGKRIVGDLYTAELDYLKREEWAMTPDDVLWRRTKLGLSASAGEIDTLRAALGSDSRSEQLAS